ncbi:MAG: formylmethanofuran dehydrogenase subunit E family protein [Candidatus Bathyarchaeota archaeon]|nr:MAG: formylmethanofuran dehydrogenase subunit E family protein [Candidatus Bathyarchaeota archaeon]
MRSTISEKNLSILRRAEDFHGHLGPFLVIGVRMGLVGLERLNLTEDKPLRVEAFLPLRTPISCVIDGLQIATRCTIGNGKLFIKDSEGVRVTFKRNDGKKVVIVLNKLTFHNLMTKLLGEKLPDGKIRELAWSISTMPETELFNTE